MRSAKESNSTPYLTGLIALIVIAIAIAIYLVSSSGKIYVFEGLRGPQERSAVPPVQPAQWEQYKSCGASRLVILLTDPDSAWLGLANGLQTTGIPFCITRDYQQALLHRVVLVYPTISGKVLPAEALRAPARFPAEGGTLIGQNVEGGGLNEVFGFEEARPSRSRRQIEFEKTQPIAAAFIDPRESTIIFSNPKSGANAAGSFGYTNAQSSLARFEDGTAAITTRQIGTGKAYAFGIDLGFVLLTGYNNREQGVSRSYVNEFEPSLDVLLRLLDRIYREGEPAAVSLHTVPDAKTLSVLITHDIDYSRSLANAVQFAQHEKSEGIRATYFIQTKYMRDWNDDAFFNDVGLTPLKQIRALGMEVASHSVAHSLQFNKFPLGTGEESYPDYRPFVRNAENTEDGSVLGELRVSRFLLEHFLPGEQIVTFRPGHLRTPYSAPQALEATGYRFSSSVTANNSLTHFPFRLTYGRETAANTGIFEFPVTIEDETSPSVLDRLPQALAIADRLARYGGLFVVLIHTDVVGKKLEFEKQIIAALRERAWFGSVREFGQFWAARDRVGVDVTREGGILRVALDCSGPIVGLTLRLPKDWRVVSAEPQKLGFEQRGDLVVLGALASKAVLTLERSGGI